jgi:hypothetical protein
MRLAKARARAHFDAESKAFSDILQIPAVEFALQ